MADPYQVVEGLSAGLLRPPGLALELLQLAVHHGQFAALWLELVLALGALLGVGGQRRPALGAGAHAGGLLALALCSAVQLPLVHVQRMTQAAAVANVVEDQ